MAAVFLIVLVLVTIFLSYRWYATPVSQESQPAQTFIIPKGQAVSVIAERLTEAGLIKHPLQFRVAVKKTGLENKLQAGSFQLSPSQTVEEIATELTQGSQDIWITIVEGWRMEEIAESLSKLELPLFDQAEFESLVESTNTEGQLFPETYLIPKEYDASQIHSLLTTTFDQKVIVGLADEIASSTRSLDDILIMASLIEREAREYEEMRGVSGVLWNRIELGKPLQVDATMQYAKGYSQTEQSWWPSPMAADKAVQSPYNTYQVQGLPPTPIANPGLQAIRAALNPLPSDNLFYLHDRSGIIHYGQTLEEHNANVNRYLR